MRKSVCRLCTRSRCAVRKHQATKLDLDHGGSRHVLRLPDVASDCRGEIMTSSLLWKPVNTVPHRTPSRYMQTLFLPQPGSASTALKARILYRLACTLSHAQLSQKLRISNARSARVIFVPSGISTMSSPLEGCFLV